MSIDISLIVLGTDPAQENGGIAFAIPGHLAAYRSLGLEPIFIATHSSASTLGKWLPWLQAIPALIKAVIAARRVSRLPVVICHVGGGALSMLRKYLLACLARLLGGQIIMQLHGLEVDDYLASGFGRHLFSVLIAPAGVVAVLTPWWQSRLQEAGITKPVYVIPNPLPAAWEQQAAQPRVHSEKSGYINMLAIARLVPGKGVDDLIDVMGLLPNNYRLAIAGTGVQQAELESRVGTLGLQQRVRFHGWVTGETKQRLFDDADIFCLPSRYDSFGMGYLEAMANGLPVVAYQWGPIADVVIDQRCGYLAKVHSPAALAESIKRLESADSRRAIGASASDWVLDRFAVARIGQDVKNLLESRFND